MKLRHALLALFMTAIATATAAQDAPEPGAAFVAGTTPSQRPAEAPVIQKFEKSDAWYENALHGVSQPYPDSLRFLDDQGAWFTPFNHPGMAPGPYDIRGWHTAP